MRQLSLLVATILAFFIMLSFFLMSQTSSLRAQPVLTTDSAELAAQAGGLSLDLLEADAKHLITPALTQGQAIMPHLNNETIKAELGRASWRLFHTILGRFPEHPTIEEREALNSFLHLFARLYPCGECAEHFQQLLTAHPPQTSSREAAAQWGCHIHNKVNESLNKKIFDCSTISEVYMCGCEEDDKRKAEAAKKEKEKEKEAGAANAQDSRSGRTHLDFETMGLTRGG